MTDQDKFYQLSNRSYDSTQPLPADFTADTQLSTSTAQVSVDKEGNPYIAFRGTKTFEDIFPDVDIALGLRGHPRYQQALDLTKNVETKYGKQAQVTGHSLGGTIAEHVSDKLGNKAVVFNPGKSLFGTVRPSNERLTIHRKENDPISSGLKYTGKFDKVIEASPGPPLERRLRSAILENIYNIAQNHSLNVFAKK